MRRATNRPAATSNQPDPRPVSWRRNLYALWIAQTLALVGFGLRDSFLPFYIKRLGSFDTEQAAVWSGLIAAGGAGVMAVSAPIWGVMADRRGRKPMVLRAMFGAMLTIALSGLATAPWHLLSLRLLEGGLTGTVTACTALVAATAPKDKLGYSLGLLSMAVFSGSSLGPFFGGLLADLIGYRATFFISSSMLASAGVIVYYFVQERFSPPVRTEAKNEQRGLKGMRVSLSWMMAPLFITMIAVLFVSRLAQMAVRPIFPLYVEELGNYSDKHAASVSGMAFGLLGLTSAIASVYLGKRGDKVGHQRILVICTLLAALFYLPMALANQPWHLVVLQGLFGIAAGGLIPAANALVANHTSPERRGVTYGITNSASSLGSFVGPLSGSAIAATLGFRATFAFTTAVLIALTIAIAYTFSGARRRAEDRSLGLAD
jgi:DHA1 family multidrug resistance protein-like MFS transporter